MIERKMMRGRWWEEDYERKMLRRRRRRRRRGGGRPIPRPGSTLCASLRSRKCTWTCHRRHFVRKFTWKMPDANPPGQAFCASLRSRNAHGHVTTGILRKFAGKVPNAPDTTSIEHRTLTLTVRTLQCGHIVWGTWFIYIYIYRRGKLQMERGRKGKSSQVFSGKACCNLRRTSVCCWSLALFCWWWGWWGSIHLPNLFIPDCVVVFKFGTPHVFAVGTSWLSKAHDGFGIVVRELGRPTQIQTG